MLLSQIAYHTFLCFLQPMPLWDYLMEIWDMPNNLGLFRVVLLTVPLYNWQEHFIIVQVTLPTPYHWVLSNFELVFISFHLNLLNIVTLFTLKVVLGDHPIRQKNFDYLQILVIKFNSQINSNVVVPTVCDLLKQNIYQIIHQLFGHFSISRL